MGIVYHLSITRVPFLMQEANIVDRGPGKMLYADMEIDVVGQILSP